ncbi:hypothetical protein M404DRAFT_27001 [Pisolithus tinctorius Marx 270]|uniref:Uncharacterized protein n=1 Tax=Pisolithus tinctorius Marx 270 TaxID=870435 RepID=A0A0C3J3S1_PISTI|nr:hypothetical protein M404DRAFT_27001 [Pisolithus tinctorius Marx 270]
MSQIVGDRQPRSCTEQRTRTRTVMDAWMVMKTTDKTTVCVDPDDIDIGRLNGVSRYGAATACYS